MKPSLKKVGAGINGIFDVLYVDAPHFYPYWHYHPQYEIMLIQKSSGTQYIGDNISHFTEGDVYILGSNIPHIFRNPPEYFEAKSKRKVKATVLYISMEFICSDFFSLSEMQSVKDIFSLSKRGIKIQAPYREIVARKFVKCINSENEEKIINFLALMNFVACNARYKVLSSSGFDNNNLEDKDLNKLNKIFDHILNNFHDNIDLNEIAAVANMSTTAFCRFFKKHTNKTMVAFLNEIRIGNACKLLIEDENMNITEICLDCGFNNLTNFNIQFKKLKGCSPSLYRQKYHQQKSIQNSDF